MRGGVGEPAPAALRGGAPPHRGQRGCAVSDACSREERKVFRLFGKGPLGDDFWPGVGWEGVRLDTELPLGAGGAEGLETLWGEGRQTVALPRVSHPDRCCCSLPSGVLPCCAPHLVSGVR